MTATATSSAAGEASQRVIDTHTPPPSGNPCPSCGCPLEASDKFCPACGSANVATSSHPPEKTVTTEQPLKRTSSVPKSEAEIVPAEAVEAGTASRHFRCGQCGAEVMVDPQQRSYTCAFCDSNYVAEFTREETGRQQPEFIIGFAITPDQARDKFRSWIRQNAWFNPGDLSLAAVEDKQRGLYLPFWSFPMFAESEWSASIGEHWLRTETYTVMEDGKSVTKTRTVTETEWWPLRGRHHHFYNGYLVSGSKGLPQAEAQAIMPFNLPALKRYEPYYLAGWICEEYSIDRAAALVICQAEYQEQEKRRISAFLPGDTSAQLQVSTRFRNVSSDLCLLPVYVLSYRYKDKLYRFLVNGQTGNISGEKPLSWQRIGIAIGIGVMLVAFIVLMIMILAAR